MQRKIELQSHFLQRICVYRYSARNKATFTEGITDGTDRGNFLDKNGN